MLWKSYHAKCLKYCGPINETIMLVKIKTIPVNVNIVHVYAPTSEYEEDIKNFYTNLTDHICVRSVFFLQISQQITRNNAKLEIKI